MGRRCVQCKAVPAGLRDKAASVDATPGPQPGNVATAHQNAQQDRDLRPNGQLQRNRSLTRQRQAQTKGYEEATPRETSQPHRKTASDWSNSDKSRSSQSASAGRKGSVCRGPAG